MSPHLFTIPLHRSERNYAGMLADDAEAILHDSEVGHLRLCANCTSAVFAMEHRKICGSSRLLVEAGRDKVEFGTEC